MYSPKLYIRDRWIYIPLVLSLIFQGLSWWYLFFHVKYTAEQVFLHYNIISGVDLLGDWKGIFVPPLVGLVVFFINFIFSFLAYERDRFLSRFLSSFSTLFEIFLFIGIWLIAGLNI